MSRVGNAQKRFACHYPGCTSTYQRKEHLNRHEAQHAGDLARDCPLCNRSFSRSDSLRRHIRHDHDAQSNIVRASQACRRCRLAKVRCRGGSPCAHCRAKGYRCIFTNVTSPERDQQARAQSPNISSTGSSPSPRTASDPADPIKHYVHLYFAQFHSHWPILHRSTFSIPDEPPLLLQAVLMIGLWVSGNQSAQDAAVELHTKLGAVILEQKDKWEKITLEKQGEDEQPVSRCPIATYQAIVLYIIFSLIIHDNIPRRLDARVALPPSDTQILAALVGICRRNNLFYYPCMLERYREDVSSVTCIWVGVEEIKRLGLVMYRVSRLCSQTDGWPVDESSDDRRLHLSDLRFPMPESRILWDAESNAELSRLLQIEASRNVGLDTRNEENWISTCSRLLENGSESWWI